MYIKLVTIVIAEITEIINSNNLIIKVNISNLNIDKLIIVILAFTRNKAVFVKLNL